MLDYEYAVRVRQQELLREAEQIRRIRLLPRRARRRSWLLGR